MPLSLTDGVHPSWHDTLTPHVDLLAAVDLHLRHESAAGLETLPSESNILRAFRQPLESVKVVIVGQDPYPTSGHAVGMAFSVGADVRPLPRSLQNIYAELRDDLGIEPSEHGDLSRWVDNGVLLLNRVLTVRAGEAGSHRGIGWEAVTASALEALGRRGGPLVAILWGNDAATAATYLGDVPVIASAHPSPLSARRGFFGSRPFSRANEMLISQGGKPLDWRV